MTPIQRTSLLAMLVVGLLLILAACVQGIGLFPGAHGEALLVEEVSHVEASEGPQLTSDAYLKFHSFAPIQGVDLTDAETAIAVLTRSEDLTAYPCSNCHTQPLEELQALSAAEGQLAHWNIPLKHADESTMSCTTCHSVDENVDQLHTLTGEPVEFDASYGVCAQCHAGEFEEWLGGAHGKRVGGWAEPRVIQSCTDCHNPHDPSWDVRWPAMPPQKARGQ